MNPLFAAAVEIQTFCAERGWRSTVIEGRVVQRWGEPRQTRDVDLTLLTGLGGDERFVDPLLEHYRPRIPDARQFALERRVLLLVTRDGVPLDITLGGLPYETRVVERSTASPQWSAPRSTPCTGSSRCLRTRRASLGGGHVFGPPTGPSSTSILQSPSEGGEARLEDLPAPGDVAGLRDNESEWLTGGARWLAALGQET